MRIAQRIGAAAEASSGGGAAAAPVLIQGTSPPGSSIWHSAELYLGPANGYSYSSGGAGYLPGVPFDSKLTWLVFRTAAMAVDSTVRLRTSGGTQLYSKVLTAGQTVIDEAVDIDVAHDGLVQLSVTPASGGPAVDAWSFGWKREIAS